MKKRIDIIGAGFSGMTLAYLLAKAGHEVHVYEKSNRVGGLIGTHKDEFGLSEQAANSILASEKTLNFFDEIGFKYISPLKDSKKRFLFRGKPSQWPLNFYESIIFILHLPRLIFSPQWRKPRSLETLNEWGIRVLGSAANLYILAPAMQGIYAGDHNKLSASLILGKLFSKNKVKSKGLYSGQNGLQELIDSLFNACKAKYVQFHLNSEYHLESTPEYPTIIATAANHAGSIVEKIDTKLAKILKSVEMNSVVTATLFFDQWDHPFKGFGLLIPRQFKTTTLGILNNSFIFENRNKNYNETFIMGGATSNELSNLTDQELLKLIAKDRQYLYQSKAKLLSYQIFKWPKALPHYTTELENSLIALKDHQMPKNIYLHGNYIDGIGLSKIFERSLFMSNEISNG